MLHLGVILFALFSAVAAFAGSADVLIVARALMGIGGACIFPTTLSILTNVFTEPASGPRPSASGPASPASASPSARSAAACCSSTSGGARSSSSTCRSASPRSSSARSSSPTRRTPTRASSTRSGSVLSIVGLFGLLFALIEGPDKGWTSTPVLAAFAIGLGFLATFAWWELHADHPMLDIRFFKNPRFSAASATITLTYFALFGSTFLLTQYFQFVLGYSPLKAGVMTAPVAVGLMIGGPLAPRFVHRFGTKLVVAGGLSIVALCLLAYASDTLIGSVAIGMAIRLCFGFGMGLTTAPATESIMGSLPPGRPASARRSTTRPARRAVPSASPCSARSSPPTTTRS